jgi:hypothetical protein
VARARWRWRALHGCDARALAGRRPHGKQPCVQAGRVCRRGRVQATRGKHNGWADSCLPGSMCVHTPRPRCVRAHAVLELQRHQHQAQRRARRPPAVAPRAAAARAHITPHCDSSGCCGINNTPVRSSHCCCCCCCCGWCHTHGCSGGRSSTTCRCPCSCRLARPVPCCCC